MKKKTKRLSLVTGSTQGMGLSIAEKLGSLGNKVIISSRKEENSFRAEERLKSGNIDFDYFTCDFNNRNQRKELVKYIENSYDKLDVLVLTVQSMPYLGDAIDVSEKEFHKMYNTNIKNTFFTIVDFLPLLKKGKNASVIILGSHASYYSFPYIGVFSISKSVLLSITKLLANELSEFNIRVNSVNPGTVKTRIASSILTNNLVERNFLKRDSLPHETAAVCAFLTTEDSSYINGENVSVNGGMIGRL
jgi:dehydrogenase/reductase SDR family protein 4